MRSGSGMDEELRERWELSAGRIRGIAADGASEVPWRVRDYFACVASFLVDMIGLWEETEDREQAGDGLERLRGKNQGYYGDILPGHYAVSYANPVYAGEKLGPAFAGELGTLYMELRGMIVFACEGRGEEFVRAMELFLQVYGAFAQGELPWGGEVREILSCYVHDYCADNVRRRIRETLDPSLSFAAGIVRGADLSDPSYLYRYGEYVTRAEERTAVSLSGYSQEEIDAMARAYTEGFRRGLEAAGIRMEKKKSVQLIYPPGFERIVRAAVGQFEAMGLCPIFFGGAVHVADRRAGTRGAGYCGAVPNPQCDYDHRNDAALFLDDDYVRRRLRAAQEAWESFREEAAGLAGTAVIESSGADPRIPVFHGGGWRLTGRQRDLERRLYDGLAQIEGRYAPARQRCRTTVAYPISAAGRSGRRHKEKNRETAFGD